MLPFNSLLKQPELLALSVKTKEAQIAQSIWLTVSPENLAQWSHAYSLKNKQLSVFADNNAVAAKIKLLIPSLLIKLEKQGCEVTAIRVKVQVKSTPETPTKPVKKLSRHAATELTALAEKLAGSALGDALAKLAKKAN
ncbi:MAG TPA: DciA family protein [Methylotenera sp.]|nr:DciA family protein [Methylotenera sp.]HPV31524.1 DciA family protein [Methylotenera sp.]